MHKIVERGREIFSSYIHPSTRQKAGLALAFSSFALGHAVIPFDHGGIIPQFHCYNCCT